MAINSFFSELILQAYSWPNMCMDFIYIYIYIYIYCSGSMLDAQSRGLGGDGSNPTKGSKCPSHTGPVHLARIRY